MNFISKALQNGHADSLIHGLVLGKETCDAPDPLRQRKRR
jgi:hypothetical protein